MHILGICGNMRPNSGTLAVLKLALAAAEAQGAKTSFYDIAAAPLPWCDARTDESSYPPEVQLFRERVRNAQGIIIASPDYHNSFSGSLKNALDLCGADEFDHKIVGIIGVAGGATGAMDAISHMRTVVRSLGAWAVPHQVSISNSGKLFSGPNEIADPAIAKRIVKLGEDVVKYATLFANGLFQE